MSLEELNKNKTIAKTALITISIMLLILAGICVYLHFVKSKSLVFVPLLVLPITMLPLYQSLKSTEDEIKLRQSKGVQ